MANYRARQSGNWSDINTWDGLAVPPNGAGHNIYSNNCTVTIDIDVDVALITNAAITASFVGGGTSAVVGGGFTCSTNGLTLKLGSVTCGNTATFPLTTSGSANLNIIANITGSAFNNGTTHAAFSSNSSGITTVTGNLVGGSTGYPASYAILHNSSTGVLNIYGNITAGIGNGGNAISHGAVNGAGGIINVYGANLTGSLLTGTVGSTSAITNAGAGNINLFSCNLQSANTYAASNQGSGTFTASNCIFTANNNISAYLGSSGTSRLSGIFISATNGTQAINSSRWILGPNNAPTNSYIQQALDGMNSNSFVRFYTADNSTTLNQASPTDVRSGVSYASGNLTGRLTVPARGNVSNTVAYGPSMPFTATRSGTTATATLAYSYPLVVGDQITVTGASNSEWNGSYTIASVVSGTSVTFTVPATHSVSSGTGAFMQTTGTGVLTLNDVIGAVNTAVNSAVTSTINPNVTSSINSAVPTAVSTSLDAQWNKQTSTLTVSGSIGERLANASTVATTGQQITAALG